jgi:hypothetical protein
MLGALCDVGSSVVPLSDVRISGRNVSRVLLLYVASRPLVVTVPWPQHSAGGYKAVTVLV